MRLIDADALLEDMGAGCIPIVEKGISCVTGDEKTIKDYIDTQPSVQQWIPVAERLPRDKGEYLVTYHPCYWDNVTNDVCTGIDTFRGKSTWAKKKYQRVIAWMPKPEGYREGK